MSPMRGGRTMRKETSMLSAESRVDPNVAEVAAKVIDGEAIIMNLSSGLYYSMDNVGAAIWELIARRYSVREVADVIADRYGVDRERAAGDVQRLVQELLDEHLVAPTTLDRERVATPSSPSAPPPPYEPPRLQKYTDMADMLALDPPMPNLRDGANAAG
jgi:hypothetical protein